MAQNLDTNVHMTNLFSYCHSVNANPITYEPTIIAQYLKQLYDDGSVNFARSATSKYLSGYNSVSAVSHKLVTIACEAVFLYPNTRQLLT